MVDSSHSLHSNSVISEDKPSDISNSSYSDFDKRFPSLTTMVSHSSTKPSDLMANSHSVPPPVKPTESPPETFKPDSTMVTNSNPVEASVQPETSPEPQSDPALEPSAESMNTVTDSAPVIDNDSTEPPMADGPIIEEVKTTLMDEITTRISLSTSAPFPNPPVPIRITHQIGTTLKDEISTTSSSSTGDDSSSSTVLIVVILAIVIAFIVIIIFFVCKRYRKKKGQTKGGKGTKLKQTNVKVTKKKPDDANSKASAKTAKSISEMKKDGKVLKGKNIDKSKTGSSSSKSTKSGKNAIVIPSLEVDSTLESGSSSPAKIEAQQSVFVCYGNQWRQVRRVDSDFSFSIASQ